MPKVFYTENDIVDLVKRGSTSLAINDNVVLTDLAYEKANRLGLKLVYDKPENPPGAPIRPYVTQPAPAGPKLARSAESAPRALVPPVQMSAVAPVSKDSDLHQRIRSAVIARMGNQVNSALLDTIIQRVLVSTGVK